MKISRILFSVIAALALCCCGTSPTLDHTLAICSDLNGNIRYGEANKVDSMVALAAHFPIEEQYAVYLHAMYTYQKIGENQKHRFITNRLNRLPFPDVSCKQLGFQMMKAFAYGPAPEHPDIQGISNLLFKMENTFRMTPAERCLFLIYKAGVYNNCFQEYRSAISIIRDADIYAQKHDLSKKYRMQIFRMQMSCAYAVDDQKQIVITSHNILNSQSDKDFVKRAHPIIFHQLYTYYNRIGENDSAYFYWKKANSYESRKTSDLCADILVKVGRKKEAYDYLNQYRAQTDSCYRAGASNESAYNFTSGRIEWMRAKYFLYIGDTVEYERCIQSAMDFYDRVNNNNTDIENCLLSETVARIHWRRGRRNEAIRRMESASRRLTRYPKLYASTKSTDISEKRLGRLYLLFDYYRQAGRTEDALRQLILYDSMNRIYQQAQLQASSNKNTQSLYAEYLRSSLAIRSADYQRERQKLAIVVIFAFFITIIAAIFTRLYFRRKRELDAIFANRKNIEQMESELHNLQQIQYAEASTEKLDQPAEKLLFLRLEQLMSEQQLFLNPDFSREDLCRMVGSNRMYVSTCINRYANMNFNQWINKSRVNHAITLIQSGETDSVKLAKEAGFSSASTFYRNFKETTMLTPTQYIDRERLLKKAE